MALGSLILLGLAKVAGVVTLAKIARRKNNRKARKESAKNKAHKSRKKS